MATTVAVAGHGPLSFTDSNGAQRFVPLSAFEFAGSEIQLKSAWSTDFGAGDQQILLALAAARAATGELVPPPVAGPAPAISFAATVPGSEGSNVTVGVKPDPADTVFDAKVEFTVTETDVYAGLTNAGDAAAKIGVDTAPAGATDPPKGTGLVVVKKSSIVSGDDLPDAKSITAKAAGTDVKSGSKVLFTLLPRTGAPAAGIPVEIGVDATAKTFSVTAAYDSGAQSKIDLTNLDAMPAPVKFVVTAAAPSSGLAVPFARDVTLAGGAPGIAATGVAYTS
jgi:hypothetical protein